MNKQQTLIEATITNIFKYSKPSDANIDFFTDQQKKDSTLALFKTTPYKENIEAAIKETHSLYSYSLSFDKDTIKLYINTFDWRCDPEAYYYSLDFKDINNEFGEFILQELQTYILNNTEDFYKQHQKNLEKLKAIELRKEVFSF